MATQRVATVIATGNRYLVQQLNVTAGKVHCWGEVTSYKTSARVGVAGDALLDLPASTKHQPSKCFLQSEVTIEEVEITGRVAKSLLTQASRILGFATKTSVRRR